MPRDKEYENEKAPESCEMIKETITKSTPKRMAMTVEIYENQMVGWFWGLEEKMMPDFMLWMDRAGKCIWKNKPTITMLNSNTKWWKNNLKDSRRRTDINNRSRSSWDSKLQEAMDRKERVWELVRFLEKKKAEISLP